MAVLSMSKQEFNRLDVLLRVLHFQPGAFKWGQTDERPSFPVGGYLNRIVPSLTVARIQKSAGSPHKLRSANPSDRQSTGTGRRTFRYRP